MRRPLLTLAALIAALVGSTAAVPVDAAVQTRAAGLVVRYDSWGPLELGMTHREAWRTGMVSREAAQCAPGYLMTDEYVDRGFVWWRGTFPRMRVRLMIVTSDVDRTANGSGVGTTLRRLRAVYPDLQLRRGSALDGNRQRGDDFWVAVTRQPNGAINFQFPYGSRPHRRDRVESIVVSRKPTYFPGC